MYKDDISEKACNYAPFLPLIKRGYKIETNYFSWSTSVEISIWTSQDHSESLILGNMMLELYIKTRKSQFYHVFAQKVEARSIFGQTCIRQGDLFYQIWKYRVLGCYCAALWLFNSDLGYQISSNLAWSKKLHLCNFFNIFLRGVTI